MTLPNLLSSSDFDDFNALDTDWFLGAIGDSIRDYCGWHIFPSVAEVDVQCPVGANGMIMLQSLKVASVESVTASGAELDPTSYTVHPEGWIQLHPSFVVNVAAMGQQVTWPGRPGRYATVSFTHGYETIPRPIAEVGFELTARTLEKPAGMVKDLTAGPYRFQFGEYGPVLNGDQKRRLAPYTLGFA